MEFFIALLVLGLYFVPTINAMSRSHHNRGAIFVLNLVPGGLLLALVHYHQQFLVGQSVGGLLALALSGQLAVYQLLQWVAIFVWLRALVWSCTYVRKEAPPHVAPVPNGARTVAPRLRRRHAPAAPGGLLVMATVGLSVGTLAALAWQSAEKAVPTIPTIARSQTTPEAPTPPKIVTESQANKKVSVGDAVKREAERVQWCRAELRKPPAQRLERARRSCADVR